MLAPLPLFTPIYPGETLSSYLLRLTRLNHYQSVKVILDLVKNSVGINDREAWFNALSQLTTIPSETLYLSTHHRAAECITDHGQKLRGFVMAGTKRYTMGPPTLRENGRPERKSVFCPLCLIDSCYHRLHWQSRLTSLCLDHNCLLLSACPRCGANISIEAIVSGECRECYFHLKDSPVLLIEGDPVVYDIQSLVQSWWGYQSDTNIINGLGLPNCSTRKISTLLTGFHRRIQRIGRDLRFYHSVKLGGNLDHLQGEKYGSELQNLEISTTAGKILLWWPIGFHKFLRSFFEWADSPRTPLPDRELGNFFESFLYGQENVSDFSFVNREIYLLASFSSDFKENFRRVVDEKYWDFEHKLVVHGDVDIPKNLIAARRKAKSSKKQELSLNAGVSATLPLPIGGKQDSESEQTQSEVPLVRPELGVDNYSAALELGTTPAVVQGLVSLGFLSLLEDTEVDTKSSDAQNQQIDRQSINKFLYGMFKLSVEQPREMGACTPINDAVQFLGNYGISKASLIGMINNGWISMSWNNDSIEGIGVASLDLAKLKCRLEEGRQFYSLEEIADMWRVSMEIVEEWIEKELLASVLDASGTSYVIGRDLHDFCSCYVDMVEACRILNTDSLDLHRWVVDTFITPVYSGIQEGSVYYLFNRGDLQRFSPQERQNPFVFKQNYGVSMRQVKSKIRKKQIEFLSPLNSKIKKEIPHIRILNQQAKK